MSAARLDLTIECNSTFTQLLTLKDATGAIINLTGCSAKLTMTNGSNSVTLVSPTDITLGGANGTVLIAMAYTATAALAPHAGQWKYDLLLTNTGVKTRAVEGMVNVKAGITT